MNFKDIKKLISIANTLDSKGLWKEADELEKIAGDIINFEDRVREIKGDDYFAARENNEEEAEVLKANIPRRGLKDEDDFYKDDKVSIVKDFIEENLSPNSTYYEYDGEETELKEYAYSRSPELREYMIEVVPDLLSDLAKKLDEKDIYEVYDFVKDVAFDLEDIKNDEDYSYIIKAMEFYLKDQDLGI